MIAADAKKREEDEQKAAELEVLDNDVMVIERGIKIVEAAINEGNDELEGLLWQSCLDGEAVASAHDKTSMGVKRKIELESALAIIREKHKKVWMIGYGHARGLLCFIVKFCYACFLFCSYILSEDRKSFYKTSKYLSSWTSANIYFAF